MNRVPRRAPLVRLSWIAVGLLLALPASAAKVYQWKDAKGVTHYTDLPPSQAHTARQVGGKPTTPVAAAAKPVVNANCTNARSNLRLLQGTGSVGVDADQDGKPERQLTAAERASRTKLAEVEIETYCGAALDQQG